MKEPIYLFEAEQSIDKWAYFQKAWRREKVRFPEHFIGQRGMESFFYLRATK